MVNSNHHQAVDRPGENLKVVARSADGLAEAVEWEDTTGRSFLLLVQWHPERLAKSNVLSLPLGLYFLKAADEYNKKRNPED